jgi:hypothetical protein
MSDVAAWNAVLSVLLTPATRKVLRDEHALFGGIDVGPVRTDDYKRWEFTVDSEPFVCRVPSGGKFSHISLSGWQDSSRMLLRELCAGIAQRLNAPYASVRNQNMFATLRGVFLVRPTFFPPWAQVVNPEFSLDSWFSDDVLDAAPQLRTLPIPEKYERVAVEGGMWWVFAEPVETATTEDIRALWDVLGEHLYEGGRFRRAVPQKLLKAFGGRVPVRALVNTLSATDGRLRIHVVSGSKTPLDLFSEEMVEWAEDVDFWNWSQRTADREMELVFSMDFGMWNPYENLEVFDDLLQRLQRVGSGNEVVGFTLGNS